MREYTYRIEYLGEDGTVFETDTFLSAVEDTGVGEHDEDIARDWAHAHAEEQLDDELTDYELTLIDAG